MLAEDLSPGMEGTRSTYTAIVCEGGARAQDGSGKVPRYGRACSKSSLVLQRHKAPSDPTVSVARRRRTKRTRNDRKHRRGRTTADTLLQLGAPPIHLKVADIHRLRDNRRQSFSTGD